MEQSSLGGGCAGIGRAGFADGSLGAQLEQLWGRNYAQFVLAANRKGADHWYGDICAVFPVLLFACLEIPCTLQSIYLLMCAFTLYYILRVLHILYFHMLLIIFVSTSSTDTQTSGGLLVACAPEAVEEVLRTFREGGFEFAAVVGSLVEGSGLQVD